MNRGMSFSFVVFGAKILQGCLIGLGAVLPGISGGVLCVIFGIYQPVMEFLAHPAKCFKTHVPGLIPIILGSMIGFLGVANVLAVLLQKYPSPSVCVFVGLIAGMLPALFREAGQQGRGASAWLAFAAGLVSILAILGGIRSLQLQIIPGNGWYVFCGVCLALSLLIPGMSFSTLLMPLGLYEPFVAGIGSVKIEVLMPGILGAVFAIIFLSKAVNYLFRTRYAAAFHGVIGIVIGATVMILPVCEMAKSVSSLWLHCICIGVGILAALLMSILKTDISSVNDK